MFLNKKDKILLFLLILNSFFFKPLLSLIIYDGKTFVKNSNNYFYFDSLDLLNKKQNLIHKVLIENKKLTYLETNCYVSDQNPNDLGGNVFIADNSKTKVFSKWVFKAEKEGLVTITCKAKAELSSGEVLEASESKQFVVGNPNEICNPNDLLFSNPNLDIDYLELIRQSYYFHKTGNKPLLFSFTFQVNTENLKGQLENVVINCSDYTNNYPLKIEGKEINYLTNIVQRDFDVYLTDLFDEYKEQETILCKIKAYCDFYGNKELSKEIEKSFTFQLKVNPLDNSTFYLVNSTLLNFSNQFAYLYNLTKHYQQRGSLQLLEAFISPYVVGFPGLIIDLTMNPSFLYLGKLFGKLAGCSTPCSNPSSISSCLSCDFSVLGMDHINPHRKVLASISITFFKIHFFTSWIPLFFTTLFSIKSLPIYYLANCDVSTKWIYKYSGNGVLFAVLNMGKYSLSTQTIDSIERNLKVDKHILFSEKEVVNNIKSTLSSLNTADKLFGYLRIPQEYAEKIVNVVEKPFEKLINWLANVFGISDIIEKPCVGDKKSNPPYIASSIFKDYILIAGGVGRGDFFSISQTPQAKLLALTYLITANIKKMDDECKIKNTFYPFSFIGKKESAFGVRFKMNKKDNGEIEIKKDLSPKIRSYDVCPLTVAQALSKYLVLLSSNAECLIKYTNWKSLEQLFPNYDGDLTKILNENLSKLIINYGNIDIYQLKNGEELLDYKSLTDISSCANIRKYILCLEEELVNECKSNKWKVAGYITLESLTNTFINYLSNSIVNLAIKGIFRLTNFDVCGSSFNSIKSLISLVDLYSKFENAEKALAKAEECFQNMEKVDLKNLDLNNKEKLEKLTIKDCVVNVRDDKTGFFGWLDIISLITDPNSLNNYIASKLRDKIRDKIDNLIKVSVEKCSLEKSKQNFNFIGLDQIFVNGQSFTAQEVIDELSKYGVKEGLILYNLNLTIKPDGVIYFKKLGQYCLNPSEGDLEDCNKIKSVYPNLNPNKYYCIRTSKSKYIKLSFYNSFSNCDIYLIKQKEDGSYEKILLYSSNDCKGEQEIELSNGIYNYFGKCDNPKEDSYTGIGFNIEIKAYNDENSYEEASWELNITDLCSGLPSQYVFEGNGC